MTTYLVLAFTYKSVVLNLGSEDRFQGVRELGWERNYKFIFTNP